MAGVLDGVLDGDGMVSMVLVGDGTVSMTLGDLDLDTVDLDLAEDLDLGLVEDFGALLMEPDSMDQDFMVEDSTELLFTVAEDISRIIAEEETDILRITEVDIIADTALQEVDTVVLGLMQIDHVVQIIVELDKDTPIAEEFLQMHQVDHVALATLMDPATEHVLDHP